MRALTFLLLLAAGNLFAESRSVVLITIDTLRADYVGYSGSKNVQTPALDALATRGARFLQVRTPVPLTLPAHASIMTALYPPSHGVRDNATFRLDENKLTLAEILKKNGYSTAAFTSSFVLDHRFGLVQGFDVYDDHMSQNAAMSENTEAERVASDTYAAFHSWFSKASDKSPYFVWLHFYDPHAPYTPPAAYAKRYSKNPYAGEVAYVDSIIGKVISDLQRKKNFADAIIAVVGDHGEGLGEHNEKTHSVLIYNSTLHVPMLIVAPHLIQNGQTVNSLCRTIDLAPTILDYSGFPQQFGEGRSLRNVIEGKPAAGEESYSESLYPRLNLGWSELKGFQTANYHYLLAPKPELYDLAKDPAETQNVIQQNPSEAAQLKKKLAAVSESKQQTPQKIDPESAEKLRSLGYVSGTTAPVQNSSIDPKDRMNTWNDIQVGLFEFGAGRYRLAAETFRKVAAQERQNPLVFDSLCSSWMRLEDWQQAETCYKQAAQNGLRSASLETNLGIVYFNLRRLSEARVELQKAVAGDPINVTAHYYLAETLRTSGDLQAALIEYKKALEINPTHVFALNGIGRTYSNLQRSEEALQAFQKAVELDPKNPAAYFNLGVQLERMGRTQQAIEALEKFLTLANTKEFAAQREKAAAIISRLKAS